MVELSKLKQLAETEQISLSLVFKEYIQLMVLGYLFKKGLFSDLVFQGGTALRLAYQGVRYSEDLDFVLKQKDSVIFKSLADLLRSLAGDVKKAIPFISQARIKPQKETDSFRRYCLIVDADFLSASDRTNIEVANVPSYEHHPVMLRHSGAAGAPAVTVETVNEILSDKIIALGARSYVKGRDLWDIYYLMNSLRAAINPRVVSMVKNKIADYGLDRKHFPALLMERAGKLPFIGVDLLAGEMDRFLPVSYREAYKEKYREMCEFNGRILEEAAAKMTL